MASRLTEKRKQEKEMKRRTFLKLSAVGAGVTLFRAETLAAALGAGKGNPKTLVLGGSAFA